MPAPSDRIITIRRYRAEAEKAEAALKRAEATIADPNTDRITLEVTQARLSDFRRNAEETWQSYMEVKHNVQ